MFHGDRWAAAFINASGNAEAGLACLKAMTPPVKAISGMFFGHFAAVRVEKILREGIAAAGFTGQADNAAEYSIRFICLLVEKNCFRHIDSVLQKIEQRLDEQKGTLTVIAESAVPMDSVTQEELRRQIAARVGTAEIKMKTRLVPELLGGYRLRIGGFCIDASLKGQLKKMTADLEEAVLGALDGGVIIA